VRTIWRARLIGAFFTGLRGRTALVTRWTGTLFTRTVSVGRRGHGRFNAQIIVGRTFRCGLDGGREAGFGLLGDLELGFPIKDLDSANIFLGDVTGAADQRDQPFGVSIIIAAR
jgi:hypothetical protein